MIKWFKKIRKIDDRKLYEIHYNKDRVSYKELPNHGRLLQVTDGEDLMVTVKMKPDEIVGPDMYGKYWYTSELLVQLGVQCKVDWYPIQIRKIIDTQTAETIWERIEQ